MNNRIQMQILFIFMIIAAALSCRRMFSTAPAENEVFYFNSFETADDAKGWNGLKPDMFVDAPAPGCGNKSLQIGGGCVQPAAWIVFPKITEGGRFKVSCWGMVDQPNQSGAVAVRLEAEKSTLRESSVRIADRTWTHYESDSVIVCPAGGQLRLELRIGGILFASMHLDGLTVERVGE
jgi:hypothetical protein